MMNNHTFSLHKKGCINSIGNNINTKYVTSALIIRIKNIRVYIIQVNCYHH